jgi:hypothetical protein
LPRYPITTRQRRWQPPCSQGAATHAGTVLESSRSREGRPPLRVLPGAIVWNRNSGS